MSDRNLPPVQPTEKEPSSLRLIATLGIAGFLSGVVLVSSYLFTLPMIEANRAAALEAAIYRVLPGTTDYRPLVLQDGALKPPAEAQTEAGEPLPIIFAGYDETERLTGFAIEAEEPGFQDIIAGIFGYDPAADQIIGFEVLESKETPGLGDKIMKDAGFLANFEALAVDPAVVAVKSGAKTQPNQVEAITGATISSKAVVRLLNKGLEQWRPALQAYVAEQEVRLSRRE